MREKDFYGLVKPGLCSAGGADGTPWGTWGGYVDWEPDSLEDAPDRWACTLFLVGLSPVAVDNCPVATASLDVTIRKTRSFRPAPGAKVYWRALAQPGGAVLASGEVTGGAEGLVAVPGLRIPRDPDRVRLEIATGPFDVAPADVNGDGVVNGQDLDLLGAILAGNSLAPQDTAGDVNQDVRVDILDFLELQLLLQR